MEAFKITGTSKIEASEGTIALALGGIRVGGSPAGIAATIELADGTAISASQLEGETEWIADAVTLANGYPVYANGTGARYCRLKAVKDAAIIAALDAAAGELGHDCQECAVPYVSDGALGHGWECGICGRFLQAG